MVNSALVFSRKPKIDKLDVFMFIEEYVLEFQVPMDTRVHVHIRDRADELCEDLLDLCNGQRAMLEEVVVQFIAYRDLSVTGTRKGRA